MTATDRFTRACLGLVIVLLAIIAARPIVTPQAARAADTYKYAVAQSCLNSDCPNIQAALDKYSTDGWEFVAPVSHSNSGVVLLIFRRK